MIILIKSYFIVFIRRHRFSVLMKFMLIKEGDKDILFKGKHPNSQSKLYCQIF